MIITQLVEIIDRVEINTYQFNKILKEEYTRFSKFKAILNEENLESSEESRLKNVDVKTFAKHILRFGSTQEKREVFLLIKQPLYLKNMKLYISKIS